MPNETITVIIPVHNSIATLERCVNSVLQQTYNNLEILLVNNGSTDDSLSMCKKLEASDARIKVINLAEGNVSGARNAGLNAMTGDYFAFVDSDDFIDATMYEKLYHKLNADQADMAFCYFNIVENNTVVKEYIEERLKDLVYGKQFQFIFKSGRDYVKANIWRTLFKADKLRAVRFDERLYFGEDFAYMFQIFQVSCNMTLLEECLYNYILASTTMSKKYFKVKMLQNDKIYAQYAYDFLCAFGMNDYAVAARYGSWIHVVHSVLAYSDNYKNELPMILADEYWQEVTQKKNYKQFKKLLCPNFKYKTRAFLLQHGMFGLYRKLIKRMI